MAIASSFPGRVRFQNIAKKFSWAFGNYWPVYSARSLIIAGGWDPATSKIHQEINAQIDQAFSNVELALKEAGGKGWCQVYRVNSYHLPCNDEAMAAMIRNFKKYMPDHQPLWTCIGVSRLGYDDMRIEIEVVAHDKQGEN